METYYVKKKYVRFTLHVETKAKETVFLRPLYVATVVLILLACKSNKLYLPCLYISLSNNKQNACSVLYNHVPCLDLPHFSTLSLKP